MKKFFRRLLKFVVYTAAGILIALAIAVGLFRLFLPRLPEYQAEIKNWASTAIGMRVEFSGMNARWSLTGPELAFYDAELNPIDATSSLIAAHRLESLSNLPGSRLHSQLHPFPVHRALCF